MNVKTPTRPIVRDIVRVNSRPATVFISGLAFRQLPKIGAKAIIKRSKENKFLQGIFLGLLFVLVASTSLLFAAHFFGYFNWLWKSYYNVYLSIMLVYTWVTFSLLFWEDSKNKKYKEYAGEKISVIIPCYNEAPELFRRSLTSVLEAHGNKEIIVVNDGSTNGIQPLLRDMAQEYGIIIHSFKKNKGKRHALHYAVKHLVTDSQFVVTIDSDTVLDSNALIRVVEPLKEDKIGAASGEVRLLNERQNWLTRMIGAYYWTSLNIHRKAQSSFGGVGCCSGALAAYKTKIAKKIIDDFVTQEFFGEPCTHSEDRHLTNLVLKSNHHVVYVPQAIAYTETPATVRGFVKQQLRWKRGFIREGIYTLTFSWKNRKVLFLQTLFWDLTAPFFSLGLILLGLAIMATQPSFFITTILPSWLVYLVIRNMPVFFQARDKIVGLVIYTFFYYFCLYWLYMHSLFTLRNKSWVTR